MATLGSSHSQGACAPETGGTGSTEHGEGHAQQTATVWATVIEVVDWQAGSRRRGGFEVACVAFRPWMSRREWELRGS